MKHLKSFGDALRRSFIICPLNASSLPSQLFSHIAIKSASCRNSTEVVWGAHNVQPTQMTVLGKKNPRAALSCSLPLCLQPSSMVPHGEKAWDMPENPEEPGHRTTRGVQVLHEATRGLPQPSDANYILGSWALAMPSRWVSTSAQSNQCQGTGIRTGNQHISNFSFGQVIWDWKFPFSPELEI